MAKQVKRFSYNEINTVTNDLIESIKDTNIKRGYCILDNGFYTLGYMQSMLNNIIADMPANKQQEIINKIVARTKSSQENFGV